VENRVLFVSYTAERTGPTNSLLLLLRHLRDRHDVAVLHPGHGPLADTLDAEGIRRFTLPALDKWTLPAIARLVRRERFSLVYANNTAGSARIAFLAAKIAGVPFVCHVRGMGWDRSWARLGYLRFADAVIAVSNACAASVRRFVADGRLHVVHNGVPLDGDGSADDADDGPDAARGSNPGHGGADLAGAAAALRAELGAPPDAPVLLGLAHLCRRKGQAHAIEAFRAIVRELPDARLWLAGLLTREPDYVERVRKLIREWSLEGRVELLGFRNDARRLLRAADLLLHTAVADPHPRSVIEAMAAGRPVVAFAVDGVAETVVDGVTGRLVAPEDPDALARAALELLRDPEARRRMGDAARERARSHFSDRGTADRVDAVIRDVLNARKVAR
jgi:glycosyltransferase involved in cell wall biosynthesis